MGQNESLTLKKLSGKTAFLVAFSTLSRYGLVPHLTKMSFPNLFISHLLLDYPTQSEQYIGLGDSGS